MFVICLLQEELQKKQAEGSFRSEGRNDILTVATGKQEHPGRVRGVGGGVGIRDYFGSSSRHSSSVVTREEMEHMLASVREQARAEARAEAEASFDARIEARLSKMREEMMMIVSTRQDTSAPQAQSPAPNRQSTKGSCCPIGQSSEGPEKEIPAPCDLFVEDPLRRLVARGSVHTLGSTVHHQQIQSDQVRVAVEEAIIVDAPVPIPYDDMKIVGDVLNSFILWPKTLVSIRAEDTPAPAPAPDRDPAPFVAPSTQHVSQPQLNVMQQVILMAYDPSFQQRLYPTGSVFGKSKVQVFLDREDLLSLIAPRQHLTVSIVQLFCM